MTLTAMRKDLKKYWPKTINCRSYKIFSNDNYGEMLINSLSKENFVNNDDGFQRFCHISLDASHKHAPRKNRHLGKKKHARGSQMPFIDKELLKSIMTRTKLRNIFLQNRSEEK